MNCHTYAGEGASNLGAPDLTDIGNAGRSNEYWMRWIHNPQEIKPGTQMPPFPLLSDEQLSALATFLNASKGGG